MPSNHIKTLPFSQLFFSIFAKRKPQAVSISLLSVPFFFFLYVPFFCVPFFFFQLSSFKQNLQVIVDKSLGGIIRSKGKGEKTSMENLLEGSNDFWKFRNSNPLLLDAQVQGSIQEFYHVLRISRFSKQKFQESQ